jgi:3-oxoadipate enol-lactonase
MEGSSPPHGDAGTPDLSALSHDVGGDGPPVLLLHAGVADRRMWAEVAGGLNASGYRVIAPDLAGFGETQLPSGPFSHTDLVHELQVELGAVPAVVVGNSFGSLVALDLAMHHPDAVSSLVLISTPSETREPSEALRAFWQEEERLLEAGDVEGATDLNVAMCCPTVVNRTPIWSVTCSAARSNCRRRANPSSLLRSRKGPTPQWRGPARSAPAPSSSRATAISTTSQQSVTNLRPRFPPLGASAIATGGHLLPLEQPATVVRLILDHIGG